MSSLAVSAADLYGLEKEASWRRGVGGLMAGLTMASPFAAHAGGGNPAVALMKRQAAQRPALVQKMTQHHKIPPVSVVRGMPAAQRKKLFKSMSRDQLMKLRSQIAGN